MFEDGVTYKQLTRSDRRAIIAPLESDPGYILDFSNRTIEEFFEDEFGIEFYDDAFAFNGASKKKRLEALLETVEYDMVSVVLRRLWEYRATLPEHYHSATPEAEKINQDKFFAVLDKLSGNPTSPVVHTSEALDFEPALGDVVSAIERDIRDGAHNAALDRLHTYCQKKIRLLLESKGETAAKTEALHSRMGKYIKILEAEGGRSKMSLQILKNSISIFDKFNSVRNDESLAHDNDLVEAKEARFIFESVLCVLKFMKSIDNESFGK
jgi:hypothetical protein